MPGAAMDMPEGKVMRPGPSHAAGARSCSSARSYILTIIETGQLLLAAWGNVHSFFNPTTQAEVKPTLLVSSSLKEYGSLLC